MTPKRALLFLAASLIYLGVQWAREGQARVGDFVLWDWGKPTAEAQRAPKTTTVSESGSPGISEGEIESLFAARTSDAMVEFGGEVSRVLQDDNEGSRHQRFIVRLASGHTVLIAHNIDLAQRVPLRRGDRVEIQGEYEWTEQGGVVHWTHHDPQRRHPGGWIRHAGEVYE